MTTPQVVEPPPEKAPPSRTPAQPKPAKPPVEARRAPETDDLYDNLPCTD